MPLNVKHKVIATQNHFRRYRLYHVRFSFSSVYVVVKQVPVLVLYTTQNICWESNVMVSFLKKQQHNA